MKRINLEQANTINQKIKDIESLLRLNMTNHESFRICAGDYYYLMSASKFENVIRDVLEKEKERLIEEYHKLDKE